MVRATQLFLGKIRKASSAGDSTATREQSQTAPVPVPAVNKWIRRGHVLANHGDVIGAISAFSQAIMEQPRSAEAYIGRGRAFRATGGYELAARDINMALAFDPDNADAYCQRGALSFDLSKVRVDEKHQLLSSAVDDLTHAIALDPNNADAYRMRATVYSVLDGNVMETSRGSRAVSDAYMAMKISPGFSPANG